MAALLVECAARGTLIAAGTGVILWAARIQAPWARHLAWTGVLLSMLVLPGWTAWRPRASMVPSVTAPLGVMAVLPTGFLQSSEAVGTPSGSQTAAAQTDSAVPRRVGLGLYALIACAMLARLAMGTVRARRLVRSAVRQHDLLTSTSCAAPITVGCLQPVAILPARWHEWPPAQLDAVLTHEHEHIRRRHPLVQWLALLNRAIFWFHPLAWWLERRLAALAEETCDAAVLARGHDAHDYAEYLLDIARAVTEAGSRTRLVGMAMPGPVLATRLRQILDRPPAPRVSRARLACTFAACALTSAACAVATLKPADQTRTSSTALRGSAASGGPIVVTVNGEALTDADLTRRHQELDQTLRPGPMKREPTAPLPHVLVDALDDTLIVQHGTGLGYKLDDDEFNSLLDGIKQANGFENNDQFLAALKRSQMTMADYRRNVERRMIVQRVRVSAVFPFGKSVFTEDEQRQYFDAHPEEFPLMTFQQAQEGIDFRMRAVAPELLQNKWDSFLALLRAKAVISWKRTDLRRAYETGLAQ